MADFLKKVKQTAKALLEVAQHGTNEVSTLTFELEENLAEPEQNRVFEKFIAYRDYSVEDMIYLGTKINSQKFDETRRLITDNLADLKTFLDKMRRSDYLLIIYRISSSPIWSLIYIRRRDFQETMIFYKDPFGNEMPQYLQDAIKSLKKYEGMKIAFKCNQINQFNGKYLDKDKVRRQNITLEYLSGPLTIRNWELFNTNFHADPRDFGETDLERLEFTNYDRLVDAKMNYAYKLAKEIYKNDLNLKDFFSTEIVKIEDFLIDVYRLQSTRHEYLVEKKFDVNGLMAQKNEIFTESKLARYESEGWLNFGTASEREKLYNIKRLMFILQFCNREHAVFEQTLIHISKVLDVDFNVLRQLAWVAASEAGKQKSDAYIPKLGKLDVTEREENKPGVTSSDNLINKIVFFLNSHLKTDWRMENLKKHYDNIMEKYKSNYSKSNVDDIKNWALNINDLKRKPENDWIQDAFAVIIRAFQIATGYLLKDVYILASLIYVYDNQSHDRSTFFEIKSVEARRHVAAIVAVIRSLSGIPVDIVTHTPELADENLKIFRNVYAMFNIAAASRTSLTDCGSYNVVYGTISDFQADYLQDEAEGTIRRNFKPFGQLIIDEVDNIMIDNLSTVTNISEPFVPGLDLLRYVFLDIWMALTEAVEKFAENSQRELNKRNEKLAEEIKNRHPEQNAMIPSHLKEYVAKKLDKWIAAAISAKFEYFEAQHYSIMYRHVDVGLYPDNADGKIEKMECRIVPVDAKNSGLILHDTVWPHGLEQFLQLKHNLRLTEPSLMCVYISNAAYVKKYSNVLGMTATFPTEREKNLIKEYLPNVEYIMIPRFNEAKFNKIQILTALIVEDEYWYQEIVIQTLEFINKNRSVLVICATEYDATLLHHLLDDLIKSLQLNYSNDFEIRSVTRISHFRSINQKPLQRRIIITTKIIERSAPIEGEMNVIVGFIPGNSRVEEQAFEIATKEDARGTAQLIVRQSEAEALLIKSPSELEATRNGAHEKRIDRFMKKTRLEINLKDELSQLFIEYYVKKRQVNQREEDIFLLRDLKYAWALFLDEAISNEKEFLADAKKPDSSKTIFEKFVKIITNKDIGDEYTDDDYTNNPFYNVLRADRLIQDNPLIATQFLNVSLRRDHELFYSAHIKLFEAMVETFDMKVINIKKIIDELVSPGAKNVKGDLKKEDLKGSAKNCLQKGKTALNNEIEHLKKILESDSFKKMLAIYSISAWYSNHLNDHLFSRLTFLTFYLKSVEHWIEKIEPAYNELPVFDKKIKWMPFIKSTPFHKLEYIELQGAGVNSLYTFRDPVANDSKFETPAKFIKLGIRILNLIDQYPFLNWMLFDSAVYMIVEGVAEIVVKNFTGTLDLSLIQKVIAKVSVLGSKKNPWLDSKTVSIDDLVSYIVSKCLWFLRESKESITDKDIGKLEPAVNYAKTMYDKFHGKFDNRYTDVSGNITRVSIQKIKKKSVDKVAESSEADIENLINDMKERVKKIVKRQISRVKALKNHLKRVDPSTIGSLIDKLMQSLDQSEFEKTLTSESTLKELIDDRSSSEFLDENEAEIGNRVKLILLPLRDKIRKQRHKNKSVTPIVESISSQITDWILPQIKHFLVHQDEIKSDPKDNVKKILNEADQNSLTQQSQAKSAVDVARSGIFGKSVDEIASFKLEPRLLVHSVWCHAIYLDSLSSQPTTRITKEVDVFGKKVKQLKQKMSL